MLVDDIGWGDFSYQNGTALTPNIDAWAKQSGSIMFQDFHSGGTVCRYVQGNDDSTVRCRL